MSGVFISHSARDKDFAHRLALDLVNAGVPVWFDSWEIEVGASLTASIRSGIAQSDYCIVVLSTASAHSEWMARELAIALDVERERRRRVLVPIRLEECAIPEQLGDRLYADFSRSYLEQFERLVGDLRAWGMSAPTDIPPERQVIPLVFSHTVHLDHTSLRRRIAFLDGVVPPQHEIRPQQFRVSRDRGYARARSGLCERIDLMADDPAWSPQVEQGLRRHYHTFVRRERDLLTGLADIINNVHGRRRSGCGAFHDACYWYARIIRGELVGMLTGLSDLDGAGRGGDQPVPGARTTPRTAARSYGPGDTLDVDIGPADRAWAMSIVIDADSRLADAVRREGRVPLLAHSSATLVAKYVIPQMLADRRRVVCWDLERLTVSRCGRRSRDRGYASRPPVRGTSDGTPATSASTSAYAISTVRASSISRRSASESSHRRSCSVGDS